MNNIIEVTQLTDPQSMMRMFQEHLPKFSKENREITSCSIERAQRATSLNQHRQGTPAMSILYKLEGIEPGGNTWTQRLYGKAFSSPLVSPSGLNGNTIHISGYDLALWMFPNDPTLSQLPICLDPVRVKSYFPYDPLPESVNEPEDITTVNVQPLNYLPEDRCTTRYDLQWSQSSSPHLGTLVGKTFSDARRGNDLFRLMQQIWERSQKETDAFRVAEPLRYDDTIHMFWQGTLFGTPVTHILNYRNCQEFSNIIAKGLANLHQSQLSSFATLNNRGILTETCKKVAELMHAVPNFQKSFLSMLAQLETDTPELASLPRTPIHGSFRIKELIVQDGKLGLFDFDNCTFGDPVRDLGTFIADLHRRGSESSLLLSLGKKFLKAYREQVEWDVSSEAVNWHFRTRLLEKAYWRWENKWFDPNLEKHILHIVDLAQQGCI